ncbi:DUF7269 family protein [Halostagnicola bangensis]
MTRVATRIRLLLLAAGSLSLGIGLVVLASPVIEGTAGWPWADDTLLVGFFTVAFVLATVIGSFELLTREPSGEPTKGPERVASKSAPGYDLERVLDRRWWALSPPAAHRQRLREEFQRTAIRTIVRTDGCSAESAQERIDQGTWTDDPVASAFLCPNAEPSLSSRVRVRLRFHHDARRTAREILARREGRTDRW